MSVENKILKEIKQQLIAVDRSLANKIFIDNYPERHVALPYWVTLSIDSVSNSELTSCKTLKNIDININYFRKNKKKRDYSYTSDLKEDFLRNMPRSNASYWHNYTILSESYDVDLDVDNDYDYEGFQLQLQFNKIDTITNKSTDPEELCIIDGGASDTIFYDCILECGSSS